MTAHNAAPWLREAVDSVLAQSYPDWELVAIEDGSTDESAAILASYADSRIRVTVAGENMGRTPALRRAFDLARGELIAVLDADDVAHPRRIEEEVAFLDANPDVSLVGAWTTYIDGVGRALGRFMPPIRPDELRDAFGWVNPIVHSSAMYRASSARDVGGYPLNLPYAQDGGLFLRLAERGRVGMLGDFLCQQRILPNSMTRGTRYRILAARDTLTLIQYARDHLSLRGQARRRNREEVAVASFRYAAALARTGRRLAATREVLAAVLRDPRSAVANRVVRTALPDRWRRGAAHPDYMRPV